ncbi:unnamed protein product, partial [Mesorhabditis spiculigera]
MSDTEGSAPRRANLADENDERENLEEQNADADRAIRNFAMLTDSDEAYAHMILQDVNWSVEAALEVHFSRQKIEEPMQEVAEVEISLVTWNIDGLDLSSLRTRMKAVYCVLKRINPDFIFLQEVTEREIEILEKLGSMYNIYYSNRSSLYFTAILVSKMFDVVSHEVHMFDNSGMGRSLQTLEGRVGPHKIFLLNTHLESMGEHSDKRKEQLAFSLNKMATIIRNNPDASVFFGGDLNARDAEVPALPQGVGDVWLAAGAPKKEQYTWDTQLNDNKSSGRFAARCRFDRVFWYGPLRNVTFCLEGKQRIRTTMCFPSDHWALHCTFK